MMDNISKFKMVKRIILMVNISIIIVFTVIITTVVLK